MGAFTVLVAALRLLRRHWPVVLALMIGAFVLRQGLIYLAVRGSTVDPVLGLLVLALVPASLMIGVILVLRVVRESLPRLAATGPGGPGTGVLRHVSSVLVPFMVLYTSYGYFDEDRDLYTLAIVAEDTERILQTVARPGEISSLDRLPARVSVALVAVVVAALLVRWLLNRSTRLRGRTWAGFALAYCEVLAVTVVVVLWSLVQDRVLAWVAGRTIVAAVLAGAAAAWQASQDYLIELATPIAVVVAFIGAALGSVDTVIVVPLAWLAVGAVVFGHKVRQVGRVPLSRAARDRWRLLPTRMRRVTLRASAGSREGLRPLLDGLALLRRAGLRAMLLFCLTFVAVWTLPDWLWELERLLIGPQELNAVWGGLAGPLSLLNHAAGMALVACLVAAAVERVITAQEVAPVQAQPVPAQQALAQQAEVSRA